MMEYKAILRGCTLMRNKVELIKNAQIGMFQNFPNAYCSKATLWLYDYFYNLGEHDLEIRCNPSFLGKYNIDGNHCWLHVNGYNADITCDQFNSHGLDFKKIEIHKDRYNSLYDKNCNILTIREVRWEYFPQDLETCKYIEEAQELYQKLDLEFVLPKKDLLY